MSQEFRSEISDQRPSPYPQPPDAPSSEPIITRQGEGLAPENPYEGREAQRRPDNDFIVPQAIGRTIISEQDNTREIMATSPPSETRETVEGEVMQDDSSYRILATALGTAIVGTDRNVVDTAVFLTAREHMDRLPPNAVVVVARFLPNEPSHFEISRDPAEYDYIKTHATDPNGLMSVLPTERIAETNALAAAGEDIRLAFAYTDTLVTVGNALDKHHAKNPDKETGETIKTTAEHLRDAVRVLCKKRDDPEEGFNEIPTLNGDAQAAVKASIPKTTQLSRANEYGLLGAYMDVAYPVKPDASQAAGQQQGSISQSQTSVAQQRIEQSSGRITVIDAGVQGTGLKVFAEQGILGSILEPVVVDGPVDVPGLVVLYDVDAADPAVASRVLHNCEAQGIPTIVTLYKLNEGTRPLLEGRALGVNPVTPAHSEVLSKVIGNARRKDVTGSNVTRTIALGHATDHSNNANWEHANGPPKGGGSAESSNRSRTETWARTKNVGITEGAAVSPSEFKQIRRGKMSIFDSSGNGYGMYDLIEGEYLEPFPAPPEQAIENTEPPQPQLQQGSTTAAPPAQPASREGSLQPPQVLREEHPMSRPQRAGRLRSKFLEDTGKSASGGLAGALRRKTSFPQWLKIEFARQNPAYETLYMNHLVNGITELSWEEWSASYFDDWREENGVK